jgi:hypothetical protein
MSTSTERAREVAERKARSFRQSHMLNIALAAKSGRDGDLKMACDLFEADIVADILFCRKEVLDEAAKHLEESDDPDGFHWTLPMFAKSDGSPITDADVNLFSDECACSVQDQCAAAIRALKEAQ